MAELRLILVDELFTEGEIQVLVREMEELGAGQLPSADDDLELDEALTDEVLTAFMDRLEAQDIACTVYLPLEFDGVFDVGDHTVGSAAVLMDTLEELRDELEISEEDGDLEDDEFDLNGVIEEQQRYAWHAFLRGATRCIERQLPLQVIS